MNAVRLTETAPGGGCSCKVAPGRLESLLAQLAPLAPTAGDGSVLLCGHETGDDAAVLSNGNGRALVATTDFFPPVVDDAFDWGRIAAANALSDVYAMGGEPLLALNLLAWPVGILPDELAVETLRGGRAVADSAGCLIAGGHSIDDQTPKYGLAVTGTVDTADMLRNDMARAGLPLSLTKPLGLGILNNRHKSTGEWFPEAVETMTTLNRDAARAAVSAGCRAATDVTGFGLLGHLYKLCRSSGVSAVIDVAAVPVLEGARESLRAGFVPGGSTRNLEWVLPYVDAHVGDDELMVLADAQTSGGLLVAGEVPGAPVIGELRRLEESVIVIT